MAEGFKLLDAYVEVTASGKGLAEKVGKDFESEAPAVAKRSSASFGSSLLSGFKALPSVGGSVARRVGDDFEKEAPEAGRRSSSSFGSSLLGGMSGLKSIGSTAGSFFQGAFIGVIGGLVGGVVSTVTSAIGSTVSAIGGMLTQIGSLVASTVIDFNSTLQNATIGFTTMLGSGEKSAAFLNQLQDFAKTTPFEFKNLISNAQNMMGMGIAAKDVIPDLTALGDSVASIGGSAAQVDSVTLAFDQMNAKGTLDMGNMNQLMQNGVPSALKILASSYKVTTGQMIDLISNSKIQSSDALPKLVKGLEQGTKSTAALGGMMAKQSTTFTGALSNIQDGLTQTVSKAFKPFFDTASSGMQRFATALSGKPAQKFTTDVTASLKPLASAINGWFKTVDINDIFTKAGKAITGMLKGIKPKEVIGGLEDAFAAAGDVMKEVVKVAPKVAKAIKDMGPGVKDTMKQFVDFVGAVSDMMSALNDFDHSVATHNKKSAGEWKDWGAQIGRNWDEITGAFKSFGQTISNGITTVANNVKHNWGEVTAFFAGIPAKMSEIGGQIIAGLVSGIQGGWGAVTSAVSSLINAIPAAARKLLGIASPSKVFEEMMRWVGKGAAKGLLGSVDEVKSASTTLSNAVTSAFKSTNMTSSQEDHALAKIKKVTKELVADAKARDAAVATLATARDTLAGLRSDKAGYASDLKSSVIGAGAIGGLYTSPTTTTSGAMAGSLNGNAYTGSYTSSTTSGGGLAGVKAGLRKLLTDTKAFTANLKKLVTMGLDKTTLQQLIDAGPTDGLPITADLLADPSGLKQIVSLQKQISTAAGSLSSYASGQMYDSKIVNAAQAVNDAKGAVTYQNIVMQIDAEKINDVAKMVAALKAVKQTARAKGMK